MSRGVVAAALLLSACAAWEPGQERVGQELLPPANGVLVALNRYVKANRRAPPDLAALVPRYIAALPQQPELNYSRKRGTLVFNYQPDWPDPRVSACQARIGEARFRCVGYH